MGNAINTGNTLRDEIGGWIWPHGEYSSGQIKRITQFWKTLDFPVPRYSAWAWEVASLANWVFFLRLGRFWHGAVVPILPENELAKLKTIPSGAGNILVGPHPGPLDAQLMLYLLATAHRGAAVFLMAAETYYGGTVLRRLVLNRLGVIPVARGRKNPEAVRIMSELIASGWWGGIFPEGEVYFSRQVMPMEYGAVRIAIEAALEIQQRAKGRRRDENALRPVFVTPFAHAYFFKDPKKAIRRAEVALDELERHPMVAIERPVGDLPARLRRAADTLLQNKAKEYGIPPEDWRDEDRFERTRKLQDSVLRRLEKNYLGHTETGYARRRAMKVRMVCFERLADSRTSEEARREIQKDVWKTRELILMTPFSADYRERHNDLEMWVEYLCRFRVALGMPAFNFGSQVVDFRVQMPIDVHPMATEFHRLGSEEARLTFLDQKIEFIRESVQAGVDEICKARKTMHIPEVCNAPPNLLHHS